MAFQPNLLWQYAQHAERRFRVAGYADVEVRAEAFVSVNGCPSRRLLDPDADLTRQPRSALGPKPWVLRSPRAVAGPTAAR